VDNKAYVGIILADLHWGVIDSRDLYNQYKKTILEYIEKLAILDFIIICGDFYDSKLSLNSEPAKYSTKFLKELLELVYKKNSKIRIIEGTSSHDNNQMLLLNTFISDEKYDFKFIENVQDEYLFDDLYVLYVPEEYMNDKDEYYKEYFNKKYDMIFGHGLVNEVAFIAAKQESETTMAKAPILNCKQLLSISKGPIFYGHIHIPQVIYDKFFYVGSTTRWCFGEEEEKGFYLVSYEPENNNFLTEFIINKLSKKYDTVVIDYNSTIFNSNEKQQIDFLIKLVDNLLKDYLRLIINIPEDFPNALLFTSMINEVFNKYSNVKIIINNNSKIKQKKEVEEKINLLLEKYGFIFSKSILPEEKISKYIKIKYNKNISIERIRYYLYEQLQLKGGETNN
jgi:DNA repair exonuclease SbcCD nuclease subunit